MPPNFEWQLATASMISVVGSRRPLRRSVSLESLSSPMSLLSMKEATDVIEGGRKEGRVNKRDVSIDFFLKNKK